MEKMSNSILLLHYKQLYKQSNIVYMSTFIASIMFEFIFFVLKSDIPLWVNTFVMGVIIIPIFLNRKGYYGLASLIYLSIMATSALVNALSFGLNLGFGFYFFNFAGLIIYTNWKGYYKLIALVIDGLILFGISLFFMFYSPYYVLSESIFYTFLFMNIAFNIAGVAHSAYFYMNNAMIANERLSYLSTTDLLTGIYNRSAFIEEFLSFCQTPNQNIGLIMFDIDFFKEINDSYGHLAGDEVLSELGTLLKSQFSDNSLMGRYGGEEFIIAYKCDCLDDLELLANQLRVLVSENDFKYGNINIKVTISLGVVFYPYDVNQMLDIDRLLAQVDQLLYQSKLNGRNQSFKEVYKPA